MSAIRRRRTIKRARSLSDAMDMCAGHADQKLRRPLKAVAGLMDKDYHAVYGWLKAGDIWASQIRPFERACGATFVTEWLCANAHLLAVKMPAGRAVQGTDVLDLNQNFAAVIGLMIAFSKGEAEQDDLLSAMDSLMGEIAWHRANADRARSPELDLFGETK